MFQGAVKFNSVLDFNTTNVKYMENMFRNASVFNQELKWDFTNVIDITDMFKDATSYDKGVPFSREDVERYNSHLFNGIGIKE